MAKHIVAHDVGTSGNKAVLVDTEGRVQGKCFEPYQTYYPSPGCVEQEPGDWWRAVSRTRLRCRNSAEILPFRVRA